LHVPDKNECHHPPSGDDGFFVERFGKGVDFRVHNVKIVVEGKTYEMKVRNGASLLLEATGRGIPVPFQCTTGRCGTCEVRVREGMENLSEHTELELFRLEDVSLAGGGRLACQTFVYGDVFVEVPGGKDG
jgi:ferredoxin